ncbi:penicillin-binding protein, beta-lactamase class C [Chryseobacterium populi]|uniref:Penicillin-binding protein, beta-lactamase class C n=2 Tax=Chryseobacterium populi TaxID=1144316 RepID=J3CPX9_9FLAO|nr:penicillin-binding protein, beta-lactamase class C [Chryseobacterium populi]
MAICLNFMLFSTGVFAQDKSRLLDSVFTSLYNQKKFNGNVLIADKGKIIFEKSYGIADEKTGRLLNTKTTFELASVSKQFTALGIVLLQKQGKLNYDDKISKYIPELSFYNEITIRNLLNHTSGLPDYMELFEKNWDKSKFAVNDDIIKELAKYKPSLEFKPNQKFEYSNTGYALLGSIIESVSKKSFGDFLSEYIFKPLGMDHTLVYRSRYKPQSIDNYALGYEADNSGNKILPDSNGKEYYSYYLDGIVGDGMVNSTLEDLFKWDRALYTNKLVDDNDKKLIFNDIITENGKKTTYGFGWFVKNNDKYGKTVSHSGGWAGYASFIERHLDHDKTFIFLQNNLTPITKIPSDDVRKILYNEKLETKNLKAVQLNKEQLQAYTGVYSSSDFPMKLKVFVQDASLYAQAVAEGQKAFQLTAYENHIFKFDGADIRMEFDLEQHIIDFRQGSMMKLEFTKE